MPENEQRRLPHVYLPGHGNREEFTSPRSGGGGGPTPLRDREHHAHLLEDMLTRAVATAQERIASRDPEISGGTPGFYLEFDLPKSQKAVLDKLEYQRGDRIELVATRPSIENADILNATVFVPETRREYFLGKVQAYAEEDNVRYKKDDDGNVLRDDNGTPIEKSRRPKNEALVAALEAVRIADARSLYTDAPNLFPETGQQVWWEVWLRHTGRPVFEHVAARLEIDVRDHSVIFAEREVVLVRGAPEAIGRIVANTDAVAELRLSRDTPALFMEMDGAEQIAWSVDLADRLVPPDPNAPAVCLLDSGSTRRHPLISPALDVNDHQAWRADWEPEDTRHGHGTQMSGVALYGDLTEMLVGTGPVELQHRLESVKIYPDRGANDPDLYGYITASAMGRAEVQAPDRRRAYCLAVTSDGDHWRGRPSSWSAALDDLAYGDGEDQRLIVVSAGNIPIYYPAAEYLNQNDTAPIESPAQAWNTLTVGAITEKCTITDPSYSGWRAMAPAGDLSALSRTSVEWKHDWPIKPDVVFEGGNHGIDPATSEIDNVDDLALLTTFNRPEERAFTVTGDTSAATAQIARMAAQILSDRPDLWPETVRALIIHSAEWTPTMMGHLPPNPSKTDQRLILRRYGYGVPSLDRAVRSLSSDVTMVIESDLQPYCLNGSSTRTRDMMLHDLPWPSDVLSALGETEVEMRVTLSYFVEPNPGERGWTKRHRYAGHGLRFAVKRPEESLERFRRRVNAAAREDDEHVSPEGNDDGWVLGPRLRDRGALHSDVWRGMAADLADRHAIGVYPVGGWWREKPKLERAERRVRYALAVSLRANEEIDLYTEIATAVSVEVSIEG